MGACNLLLLCTADSCLKQCHHGLWVLGMFADWPCGHASTWALPKAACINTSLHQGTPKAQQHHSSSLSSKCLSRLHGLFAAAPSSLMSINNALYAHVTISIELQTVGEPLRLCCCAVDGQVPNRRRTTIGQSIWTNYSSDKNVHQAKNQQIPRYKVTVLPYALLQAIMHGELRLICRVFVFH